MTKHQKLVYDYNKLSDRVHNLNLYMNYVRSNAPELFDEMLSTFSGLPGFSQTEAEPVIN